MNYAQDALWWRLKNQQVRDLAMLLTAPPLWHSGQEISVQHLLGNKGFRYLLSLDDQPDELLAFLEKEAPFAYRLGFYAESLLAFWFSHAPHTHLLARNIQFQNAINQQTEGAIDFLVSINKDIYHIELTCKYYGHESGLVSSLAGMNPKDTLYKKSTKLQQQMNLSQIQPFYEQLLSQFRLPEKTPIQAVSIVRGMYFTPNKEVMNDTDNVAFNPYAWEGEWLSSFAMWYQNQKIDNEEYRWLWISKAQMLSAVRVGIEECLTWQQLAWLGEPNWLVSLAKRPDGFWHEQNRYMVMGE